MAGEKSIRTINDVIVELKDMCVRLEETEASMELEVNNAVVLRGLINQLQLEIDKFLEEVRSRSPRDSYWGNPESRKQRKGGKES